LNKGVKKITMRGQNKRKYERKWKKKIPRGNLYLGLAIHEPKRRDDF
jgi:hypothetical protein